MKSEITQKIRYFHFRRPQIILGALGLKSGVGACGGITVACRQTSQTTYKLGLARCRSNEHYTKSTGRVTAKRSLEEESWDLNLTNGAILYVELLELVTKFSEFKRSLRPLVRYQNGHD
jgi:hypothetical protein